MIDTSSAFREVPASRKSTATADPASIGCLRAKVAVTYGSCLASFASISVSGVYVELEAIVLSRDIPAALRFVVDPVVRSVSRNALLTSLRQTDEAVCGRSADITKSARIPASAEHLPDVPASLSNGSSAFTRAH